LRPQWHAPPVAALGFGNVVGALADEGEIIQRAREVGMQRAEGRFLDGGGFAQQALGGGIVAGVDGFLRSLNHRRGMEGVGHPIAPAWDSSVRQYNPVGTRYTHRGGS